MISFDAGHVVMKIIKRTFGIYGPVLALAVTVLCGLSVAADQSADLSEILNRHLAAMGGREAIARITTVAAYSTVEYQGMPEKMVSLMVMPSKYYVAYDLGPGVVRIGHDGIVGWVTDANGVSRRQTDEELKPMIAELFFQNFAYAIPDVLPGETIRRDDTLIDGNRYCCLALFPAGGDSLLIYINQATGFIDFRVENISGLPAITTYADYRPVDGVMIPFVTELTTPGGPYRISARTDSVRINMAIPEAIFAPPATVAEDFRFANGADSAMIPFRLVENHIHVDVAVNGRGPFVFLLDSGAGALMISKRIADDLGVVASGDLPIRGVGGYGAIGLAEIDSLTLGGLSLYLRHVTVLNPSASGPRALTQIDGILGYDFFARFAVSIDFDRNLMTIYRPGKYPLSADDRSAKLEVFAQVPVVEADIDGQPIRLAVDLGAQTGLIIRGNARVFGTLAGDSTRTGGAGQLGGVGGFGEVRSTIVRRFRLAGFEVENPPALLAEKFADLPLPEYIEGLLGVEILKDFNITIDYQGEKFLLRRRGR